MKRKDMQEYLFQLSQIYKAKVFTTTATLTKM